ncbi:MULTISPECIES: transcription initiation factor IIB [Halorussus]|uniref:transcription initiation factor IIB n=1 Tax=Halorussus TaxID=1070314 RepID=UPI00209CFCE4|nr:transcription initiation factor IIB family protein [Halorussus vallis]USZ74372.1 transcription initiation factor IIB family protein [Halorussus vallis]
MSKAHAEPACPECDGRLTPERDETVCADCGLVVAEDRIDRGPEWRAFADDETEKERTGAPLTRSRHDRGLTTEIGHGGNGDLRLTGRKRRQVTRMRREHERARISSKAERNQVYAFTEIRRLVSALQLPRTIRDRACVLFESAQSEDLLRGRSLEGFAAAAVYATCRTDSVSRTLEEVLKNARADRAELTVAYDALNRELGLPTGPIDPREYLARFASRLGLPVEVENRAGELVERGHEENLVSGRDPSGFAAACLYTAAREAGRHLTQREAADVADVTPVTLRSTFYDLQE